jgi:glycosyltransferase involved in cell wall biosynthesis
LKKKVYITVTNDLVTDQRVHRSAELLGGGEADVCLVGRLLPDSPPVGEGLFRARRFRMICKQGFLFYAFFNIRLFLFLISRRHIDLVVSNDLDTLPACFAATFLRMAKLIYDSHEYFTEVPELQGRKFVRAFWTYLEKMIVPRLKFAVTVSESIADIYRNKYGVAFRTVRNVPSLSMKKESYSLPAEKGNRKLIIYQGAVNIGRGIEQVIAAVQGLDDVLFVIAGTGDIFNDIRSQIDEAGLREKVIMTGRIAPSSLRSLTEQADLGVSCELNMGLNYYYALPNKLFSYIHAGIPVLTSAFPEMKKIVEHYQVGRTLENPEDTDLMRKMIKSMLSDENRQKLWKDNGLKAARELCWENEQKKLAEIYTSAGINF